MRAGSFTRQRTDSGDGSLSGRLRSASDLERAGLVTAAQKGALKDMIIYGDEALRAALDKYQLGDSGELERLMHAGHLDKQLGASTTSSPARKSRAGSIDLLAELDLEGALSDLAAPGGPRKPPPSAEVLGLPHDDQLMGFDMEMPFLSNFFEGQPGLAPPDEASGLAPPRGGRNRRCGSVGSFGSACSEDGRFDSGRHDVPRLGFRGRSDSQGSYCSVEGSDISASSAHRGGGGGAWAGKGRRDAAEDDAPAAPAGRGRRGAAAARGGGGRRGDGAAKRRGRRGGDDDAPRKAEKKPDAHPGPDQPIVAYRGKISSTVQDDPDPATLNGGPAPPYEMLINFPRAKSRAAIHCVMCGRRPREPGAESPPAKPEPVKPEDVDLCNPVGDVVIPRQNKDVCRECDKALWRHMASDTHFKWCKGCKRFRNLTAFAEKLAASKCDRCRERGRQGYMRRKGGGSPPGTPRHEDDDCEG